MQRLEILPPIPLGAPLLKEKNQHLYRFIKAVNQRVKKFTHHIERVI